MGKLMAYVKWRNKNEYSCMCSFFHPLCDKYKDCEELELTFKPYEGIEECMRQRSYKREKGALKQR